MSKGSRGIRIKTLRHCLVTFIIISRMLRNNNDEYPVRPMQNFLALCASNYYNGCLFHRNIKGFMVQTGDPTNTGKGGTSIWGRKFEDELHEELKHKTRGDVSMANSGPDTNGSQFFITYGPQPHLDLKYTVFAK